MADIYTNPELYDAIHKNYNWDHSLISSIAKNTGGPVLELAAGTGRLAKLILDHGFDYTGIDTSVEFLDVAIKKYGEKATFLQQDMCQFDLGKQFKFIFIGFNSFLHNLTDKDALNCLRSVCHHLSHDGVFLVSIFKPDPSFLYRKKGKLYPATSTFEYRGSRCRIMESNIFDEKNQINHLFWQLESDGMLDEQKYEYKMRMFYPHKMDILLYESGLKIAKKMGDYDETTMNEESGMQIYVCTKS